MNRCNTIAYKNLDLSSLHRDSLKCLNVLKKNDEEQAKIFQKSLALLSTTLKDVDFNYAFLKGPPYLQYCMILVRGLQKILTF